MSRAERDCTISNQLGLHLRAAAAFVKVAERFKSDISLERDGTRANGNPGESALVRGGPGDLIVVAGSPAAGSLGVEIGRAHV